MALMYEASILFLRRRTRAACPDLNDDCQHTQMAHWPRRRLTPSPRVHCMGLQFSENSAELSRPKPCVMTCYDWYYVISRHQYA